MAKKCSPLKGFLSLYIVFVPIFAKTAHATSSVVLSGISQHVNGHGFIFERSSRPAFDLGLETNVGTGITYLSKDKLATQDSTQRFFANMATPLSEDIVFSAVLSHSSFSSQVTSRIGSRLTNNVTTSLTSLFAGPQLFFGPYSVGGAVGVYGFGTTHSDYNYNDSKLSQAETATLVPTLHLYAGKNMGPANIAFGLQLPNRVETDVSVTDTNEKIYNKSAKSSVATEIWFDSRLQIFDRVSLGSGIVYVFAEQSSRPADDYTPTLSGSSPHEMVAHSTAASRQKNFAQLRLEGIFATESQVDLASSLKYSQHSYSSPEYAQPENHNLNTFQIEVGSQFKFTHARIGLDAGYLWSPKVNFTVSDTNSTPWAKEYETGSTERTGWIFQGFITFNL